MVAFLHVRVDPVVAKAFPQFVFPGGQGPLTPTHTEKRSGNRAVCKQVRFVDRSADEEIQRPHSHEILFSDQLIPGFLGDMGDDILLHASTEQVSSSLFP